MPRKNGGSDKPGSVTVGVFMERHSPFSFSNSFRNHTLGSAVTMTSHDNHGPHQEMKRPCDEHLTCLASGSSMLYWVPAGPSLTLSPRRKPRRVINVLAASSTDGGGPSSWLDSPAEGGRRSVLAQGRGRQQKHPGSSASLPGSAEHTARVATPALPRPQKSQHTQRRDPRHLHGLPERPDAALCITQTFQGPLCR